MPNKKSPTKKVVAKKKQKFSIGSDVAEAQLQAWAHAGNEESLKKLENFIAKEKNEDLRFYASLAYGEAQYFYYCPHNDKEEKEFELARMIKKQDDYLWKLISEAERLEFEVNKQKIEETVFKRLIKKQNEKIRKAWKYRYMGDVIGLESRLQKIKEDIEYQTAWLKEAQLMIITKRYQNIPDDVFEHMHSCFEDDVYWTDDMGCCNSDCEESGDCEDDVCCPYCGSNDTAEIDNEIYPVGNYEEIDYSKMSPDDIPF